MKRSSLIIIAFVGTLLFTIDASARAVRASLRANMDVNQQKHLSPNKPGSGPRVPGGPTSSNPNSGVGSNPSTQNSGLPSSNSGVSSNPSSSKTGGPTSSKSNIGSNPSLSQTGGPTSSNTGSGSQLPLSKTGGSPSLSGSMKLSGLQQRMLGDDQLVSPHPNSGVGSNPSTQTGRLPSSNPNSGVGSNPSTQTGGSPSSNSNSGVSSNPSSSKTGSQTSLNNGPMPPKE